MNQAMTTPEQQARDMVDSAVLIGDFGALVKMIEERDRLRAGIEAALVEIDGRESAESLKASRTQFESSVYHGAVSDGLSQAADIVRKHTGVTK